MTCTRCGRDIETESVFCRYCGAAVSQPAPGASGRRLTRLPAEGKVAGVCAGIAAYFNTDATLIRLVWVILSVVPGAIIGGLIAYAAAWLVLPKAGSDVAGGYTGKRLLRATIDRKIAGVCGGLAEYFGFDPTLVRLAAVILAIYPGVIICGVLVYVLGWLVIPPAPAATLDPSRRRPEMRDTARELHSA